MNWNNFNKEIFNLTYEDMLMIEKRIIEQYKISSVNQTTIINNIYNKLNNIDPNDYYTHLIETNKLDKLIKDVIDEHTLLLNNTNKVLQDGLKDSMNKTYYRQQYATNWLLPNAKIRKIPPELINLSVTGNHSSFKNIPSITVKRFGELSNYRAKNAGLIQILNKNKQEDYVKLIDVIETSLLKGKSNRQTNQALKMVIGNIKDDKAQGSLANLMRVSRTETNRIMNEATFANSMQLKEQGFKIQKMWLAGLSIDTRPDHGELDGQVVDVDKPFKTSVGDVMFPGDSGVPGFDINCRCTTIDIVEDIMPTTRVGYNPVTNQREQFSFKTYDKWLEDNKISN